LYSHGCFENEVYSIVCRHQRRRGMKKKKKKEGGGEQDEGEQE